MENVMNIQIYTRELNADELTPVSVFKKLRGSRKFLLESSLKYENSGRYSFLGSNPFFEFKADGSTVTESHLSSGDVFHSESNPFEILKRIFARTSGGNQGFPFEGGAVGYIGYDNIRQFENIGGIPENALEMPDVHLMFYEKIIVFDHLDNKVILLALKGFDERSAQNPGEMLDEMEEAIRKVEIVQDENDAVPLSFESQLSKKQFIAMVEEAKEQVLAGEIFQVVLSQRFKSEFSGDAFAYYRKLRKSNPSPYMFFIDFEDYVVLGTSPESFIKVKGRMVTANPIAGTRRRGLDEQEDTGLEKELKEDEKELAEHRMLVDLARSDLGRVCEPGSITLTKYMLVERYKYVMHLVSEVEGKLHPSVDSLDVITASLPAGTVSGAPKIAAMKIINELEDCKRGVYSGTVGYISVNGDIDMALAIRTMVIKDKYAYVQAGAGVVYDSEAEKEYEETINKAKALIEVAK
ncbi:anthranilate synthase component I [Rossellomorea vietnamensis]|uniref:Anthranilate synthase component 1 n=1 Tax=Rossellomorea vietnamensis TaxID=218284 RepID=A0A5D4MIP9_9BACI|nr:anthranilate synthase component I [Rossellomorea vietnamensis]TYS01532.1 anthranilate synthase component I [Rossellomorea vietnamensis]